jgi:hypothetical protein
MISRSDLDELVAMGRAAGRFDLSPDAYFAALMTLRQGGSVTLVAREAFLRRVSPPRSSDTEPILAGRGCHSGTACGPGPETMNTGS